MKWISVKDSMPTEDMGDVLIYTVKWGDIERAGDCHYVAGYMEWTGEHWERSLGVKYDEDACNYMVITHWMDVRTPFDIEILPNITIELGNPDFKKRNLIHDWRNHVPAEFIVEWINLTERERQIIYIMAERQADQEEWD